MCPCFNIQAGCTALHDGIQHLLAVGHRRRNGEKIPPASSPRQASFQVQVQNQSAFDLLFGNIIGENSPRFSFAESGIYAFFEIRQME